MSLYIVEQGVERWSIGPLFGPNDPDFRCHYEYILIPEVRDCSAHDGEWHAFITMPHEVVEYEGMAVPVFEGDVERLEWERKRLRNT
jgi:hypothetical protein